MKTEPQQSETYIPMVKIDPSKITGYYQYTGIRRKTWQSFVFLGKDGEIITQSKKSAQQSYTGELSKSAQKKLKSACELLFALSRLKKVEIPGTSKFFQFRIALITLTLSAPQGQTTDRELKKELLEPFLRHFRRKGMINYIWKAERQENGNVHFHILTDCFIDKTEIRDYWNRLQAKFGFIESFHAKFGHRNPNSTDVKAVKGKNGMIQYMIKYMLKPAAKKQQLELGREIDPKSIGKIWDCSLHLKLKNDTAEPISDDDFELLQKWEETGRLKRIDTEYCTIYVPRNGELSQIAPKVFKDRLNEFLNKVRKAGKIAYEQRMKD